MKKKNALHPIRRSLNRFRSARNNEADRASTNRTLRFENLEERRVLSATLGGEDPGGDSGFISPEFEDPDYGPQLDDALNYIKVAINDEIIEIDPANDQLELQAGDKVEVVEIGFQTDEAEGVFAAEGYINKINDLTSASLIDYNDGRFSSREGNHAADGENGVVQGLEESWVVESGWDRLTINLMHYTADSTEVAERFFITMRVGQPDFEFDTQHLDQILDQEIAVGDEVDIPARWFNNLAGNFHNYAEVDIYHESDPEKIIWAGATVGNASSDNSIVGNFLNTREGDGFTHQWTPDKPGEYILRYYLDPEGFVEEKDETNNRYQIQLTVKDAAAPVAVDDSLDADQRLDVMENDEPTEEEQLLYSESFEESLGWAVNPNGTDTATSGQWEATDPVGTAWNGVQLQLEDAADGSRALVTGGEDDGSVGQHDVDGGVTSAISEPISVPNDDRVQLEFKYTFAHLSNSSGDDYLRVTVVGETESKVVLDEEGDASDRAGQWNTLSVNLSEFAGQDVQILVEVADNGTPSLVEAGIDQVEVKVPETPMMINEFTQGEHGTVTLNEDGTFSYEAHDPSFTGTDSFTYNLTDGENVSNFATVTVDVVGREFGVDEVAQGDEDSEIAIGIRSDYDSVIVTGIPSGATLSAGTEVAEGSFELTRSELDGLTIAPVSNSDVDFKLEVIPVDDGELRTELAQTIEVIVDPVIDGGKVEIGNFGILTGRSGNVPVTSEFLDIDGSEVSTVKLKGLPEFVSLSAGKLDGENWVLDSSDLDGLKMNSERADSTEGWRKYGRYFYKQFNVDVVMETIERDSVDVLEFETSFTFYAWQLG